NQAFPSPTNSLKLFNDAKNSDNEEEYDQELQRLQCSMKKTNELSILYDVDTFFICFENNSASGVASSVAATAAPSWCYNGPEDQQTFLSLIKKYKNSFNQPIKKKMMMMK
ncbi:hypothetical protein U1Q18_025324, partial [Sarracenia purpurea var. burkii]